MLDERPNARIDVAVGADFGLGSPGGVGGYFKSKDDGTLASYGWSGFARADVMALRPVWLSAQVTSMSAPNVHAASIMSDVYLGWDFYGHGNRWSAMHAKHTNVTAYACVFGRYDIALVGGVKRVVHFGEPRLDDWSALMTGLQLRALRGLDGGSFGVDMDLLFVFDPVSRGAGAQMQEVVHIGAFDFVPSVGGVCHRGVWATIGFGAGFDL